MAKVIIITTRKVLDIKGENTDFNPIYLDDDYKKHFAYYDQGGFLRQANAVFPSLIDELLSAESGNETIQAKLSKNGDELKSILKGAFVRINDSVVDAVWKEFFKLLGEVKCKDGEKFDANIYKRVIKETSVYLACEWPFDEGGFSKPKQRHLDDIVRLVLKDLNVGETNGDELKVDPIDWTFVCHDADWGESVTKTEKYFSSLKSKIAQSDFKSLSSCPDNAKVFLFQHRLEDNYYFLVRFCLDYLGTCNDFEGLAKAAEKNIEEFKKLLGQDTPVFSEINPNLPLI